MAIPKQSLRERTQAIIDQLPDKIPVQIPVYLYEKDLLDWFTARAAQLGTDRNRLIIQAMQFYADFHAGLMAGKDLEHLEAKNSPGQEAAGRRIETEVGKAVRKQKARPGLGTGRAKVKVSLVPGREA